MQDLTLVAAFLATSLFAAMAAFQATLAAGAPLGAHVLGGRYSDGLPPRIRAFSGTRPEAVVRSRPSDSISP